MSLKKILPRGLSRKLRMKLSFLPDKLYIRLFYFAVTGRFPNLKNPSLFSEKQQWLKLNDIHPEYRDLHFGDRFSGTVHIAAVDAAEILKC